MHMRLHGDRAELYRFLCPHCGKKFTTGAHMAGHVRAEHTGERPYKCESCELGKLFSSHQSVRNHCKLKKKKKQFFLL